jgi:hypothetical protein
MTADEIRNHTSGPIEHEHNRDEWYWLREIAAQLAEMNEQASMAACELFGKPSFDVEKTSHAIYGGTDFEFNLDQARNMVRLVMKYGVRA